MRYVPVLVSVSLFSALALNAAPVSAADPAPEIKRDAAVPAQPVGEVRTLRQIPEACARLEGAFTGQAAQPYKFAAVRTSPNCQPRARFVDAAKAQPSVAGGWLFNDLIRVSNAACTQQQAVVRIWRKPAAIAPPTLDAQGKSRLYLQEEKEKAAASKLAAVPMFAASMTVEGKACGG
ncbi:MULTISPECIES: hypothetical protein [Lysobacter]|uniref:hypothetical protein n=1 Tax=Lysobacter TaxID=68 RepID=UPI001F2D4A56|nr:MULTISPECIES: hypothetical protein [Lysobacter]UJB18239.1 hypothetical protein L1A79_18105 [Lysobacter capsici]UJQ28038.1 hypothetical protein L2D09_21780 [Lysobacter gummosus]